MRYAAVIVTVGVMLSAVGIASSAPPSVDRASPGVAIFFYAWYGTPVVDGRWLHWGQGQSSPPRSIGSAFYPARGAYSSGDTAVLRSQMAEIARAGVDTVIVSWWGPGSVEDTRLPAVVAAARASRLAVALHVEPWPGRTPQTAVDAIRPLRALGIRDAYVYDSTLDPDDAWRAALGTLRGVRVFAHTALPGKAARGGFAGLYTYDVLVYDGSSFGRMCKGARALGLACAPSVGPGFDATRATLESRVRGRENGRRYDTMWRSALRAAPDVVTITSYNEWHEGTQIEPARHAAAYESYDGAWGLTGVAAQQAYLQRTAYWIEQARAGSAP